MRKDYQPTKSHKLPIQHTMSHLQIRKTHQLPIEEVKRRLKPSIEAAARGYGLRLRWEGNICRFSGQARGYLQVTDRQVMLIAHLGLFAQMVQGNITLEIRRIFDSIVG